jgi:hypothetical protein
VKLLGTIAVHVKGEAILRRPGLWERIRRAFGGEPDLRTGTMKASLEAEAIVDAVRDALRSIGATNAVSLVIDDLVVCQDKEGRPDDLGDLFLAFHDSSAAIGAGFGLLRLAVEHVEAGLHLVIEVQARTEHAAAEPAVRVIVSGRLSDLGRPGRGGAGGAAPRRPQLRSVLGLLPEPDVLGAQHDDVDVDLLDGDAPERHGGEPRRRHRRLGRYARHRARRSGAGRRRRGR